MRGIRMNGPMRKRQRKKNAIRYLDEFNRGLAYYWLTQEALMPNLPPGMPKNIRDCEPMSPVPGFYAEIIYATPELPAHFQLRDASTQPYLWARA